MEFGDNQGNMVSVQNFVNILLGGVRRTKEIEGCHGDKECAGVIWSQ